MVGRGRSLVSGNGGEEIRPTLQRPSGESSWYSSRIIRVQKGRGEEEKEEEEAEERTRGE